MDKYLLCFDQSERAKSDIHMLGLYYLEIYYRQLRNISYFAMEQIYCFMFWILRF